MTTNEYEVKIKELFDNWKNKKEINPFISDGIVFPEKYEKPHIMFCLREMNNDKEGSLCEDLNNRGSGWKTWNNASRWVIALLDRISDYPKYMPKQKRIEQLQRISVMNINKRGGGPHTCGKTLLDAVKRDKKEIIEEIKLCSPNIIICCGLPSAGVISTAELLKDYVFEKELTSDFLLFESKNINNRRWRYYYTEIEERVIPVIEFCHPQVTLLKGNRGHILFELLYRDMIDIGNQFLK